MDAVKNFLVGLLTLFLSGALCFGISKLTPDWIKLGLVIGAIAALLIIPVWVLGKLVRGDF